MVAIKAPCRSKATGNCLKKSISSENNSDEAKVSATLEVEYSMQVLTEFITTLTKILQHKERIVNCSITGLSRLMEKDNDNNNNNIRAKQSREIYEF